MGKEKNLMKSRQYIIENKLENNVFLHGNKPKETVKKAFIEAHFLIFISKSEGWPKVVAEAMFWKCLPISTNVSCVAFMLAYGKRGTVVESNVLVEDLVTIINQYLENEDFYQEKALLAQKWSQKYTLDKFEFEIKKLLLDV